MTPVLCTIFARASIVTHCGGPCVLSLCCVSVHLVPMYTYTHLHDCLVCICTTLNVCVH